jgi:hypothetical protein
MDFRVQKGNLANNALYRRPHTERLPGFDYACIFLACGV